jgi:hypothetical protein
VPHPIGQAYSPSITRSDISILVVVKFGQYGWSGWASIQGRSYSLSLAMFWRRIKIRFQLLANRRFHEPLGASVLHPHTLSLCLDSEYHGVRIRMKKEHWTISLNVEDS